MNWSAAVLAGGQSKRFGQDKARFMYQERPLMAWVLQGLLQANERFIVANRPYPEFELPVYPDVHPGADALSGIHTALLKAQHPWVAIVACDQPFLNPAYWEYLLQRSNGYQGVAVQNPQGFIEPLGALYHQSALPVVLDRLQSGQFRLQTLWQNLEARYVNKAELGFLGPQLWVNANTLAELTANHTNHNPP